MNVRFCNSCKTKTHWDSTPVCTQCGCFSDPKDDNTFFSETIEYSEKREVGTSVSGPEKTRVKKIRSGGYRTGASVDSSWETFEKGKRVVSNIASALNLPLVIINSANNTYRLGLDLKFTRGRSVEVVAAACLLIACRLNNHPVLLVDFLEHLSLRVAPKVLCRICIHLAQRLHITLPPVLGDVDESSQHQDSSAYLYRFASKLSFGDNSTVRGVATTALRILVRMQEDWIHWGRHPSGLFGAALLIAARLHGFKRSRKEVSNVVYITDVTIGLRLGDFSNTPSAALSMAEFDNKDLSPCNPPAFERSQNRQTEKDLKIKWPKKLPSRPKDVQNWIENGMGFGKHDKKIKVKNAEHFEEKFEDPILLEENFEDEEENVFCDSEDLDRMADLYIIKDTKEKDRKFKIWELMNREWTETKKRKEEEKRLEKEMKSKKKPKKERKSKRTMPLGYKTVLEDFEKEESKIYNKIGDEALLDNLLDEKIDLDLFGIDGIDDF